MASTLWRQGRLPFAGTTETPNENEFNQYLGTTPNVPIQNQRWAQNATRALPGRSPLGGLPNSNTTQAPLASGTDGGHVTSPADTTDTKPAVTSPATVHATSPVDSATEE